MREAGLRPDPLGSGRSGRVSGDGGDRGPRRLGGHLGSRAALRVWRVPGSLRHLSLRHPRLSTVAKGGEGPDPRELQWRAPGARFVGSVIS